MAHSTYKVPYMLTYSNKGTTFFAKSIIKIPEVGDVNIYCNRNHSRLVYNANVTDPFILITPLATYTNKMELVYLETKDFLHLMKGVIWAYLDSDFYILSDKHTMEVDLMTTNMNLMSYMIWPWMNTRKSNMDVTDENEYTKYMLTISLIGTPTCEEIVGFLEKGILIFYEGRLLSTKNIDNKTLITRSIKEKRMFDIHREKVVYQDNDIIVNFNSENITIYWYNITKGKVAQKEEEYDFNKIRALFGCTLDISMSKMARRKLAESDVTNMEVEVAKSLITDPHSVSRVTLTKGVVNTVLRKTHDIMLSETCKMLNLADDTGDIWVGSLLTDAQKKKVSDYSVSKRPDIVVEVSSIPEDIWFNIQNCALLRNQEEARDAAVLVSDVFISRNFRAAEMEKIAKYNRVARELTEVTGRIHVFIPLGFDLRTGDVWFMNDYESGMEAWETTKNIRNTLESDPAFLKLQDQINEDSDKMKMTSGDFSVLLSSFEPKGFDNIYSQECIEDLHKNCEALDMKSISKRVQEVRRKLVDMYQKAREGNYEEDNDMETTTMMGRVMKGMKKEDIKNKIYMVKKDLNKNSEYIQKSLLKLPSPPSGDEMPFFVESLHNNMKVKLKLSRFVDSKSKKVVDDTYTSNTLVSKKQIDSYKDNLFLCNNHTASEMENALQALSIKRNIGKTRYKLEKDVLIRDRLKDKSDDFKDFFDDVVNTNAAHFAAFYEEIMKEIAHNVKRRFHNKGSSSIVRMTSWGAICISKGAQFTREKQIMVKIFFPGKESLSDLHIGKSVFDMCEEYGWFESKWLAVSYSDFEHHVRIYDRYTLLMTHLTSDRMESIKNDSYKETFNLYKKEFMLPVMVMLEHRRHTSTALQMNRYIIHSILSLFSDREGLVEKLTDIPIRSQVQSYIIYKQLEYMEKYFTTSSSELASMIMDMKTSFKESSYYSVAIPTIFGENERAEMKYIINEMYYSNLFNKEEGFQVHRSKPVMEKMAEDELNFRKLKEQNDEALEGNVDMDYYFMERMYHKFDKKLVMASGGLLSKAYLSSVDWERVTREVCKSISNLCTLRSSVYAAPVDMETGLKVTDKTMGIKAKGLVVDNMVQAVRQVQISDIKKREVKLHNKRMEKLEEEGMTVDDYNKIAGRVKTEIRDKTYNSMRTYHVDEKLCSTVLEATNSYNVFNIYMGTFPKSQIGGPREIMIQDAVSRVRIAILEIISAEFCKVVPMEMISKGDKKKEDLLRAKDELYTASDSKQKLNNIMLYNNTDQSHWGPSINLMQFAYFIAGMDMDTKLKKWMIGCVEAFSTKTIALPPGLQKNWMFSEHKETNPDLEWLKEEYKKNNWVMTFHSGMGQGMLNYLSSLYHSGAAYMASSMLTEVLETAQERVMFKERFLLSSDDKTELKLVHYDEPQNLLEFITADLLVKEVVDTGMNIHKNLKKSGYGCILGEFNSQFTLGNRVLSTAVKDIYTCMDIPDMTLPEDAVRQLLSYEKRLMEAGVSYNTSQVARVNNWHFLLRSYKYNIPLMARLAEKLDCDMDELPFTMGFMPLKGIYETCILGPDYIVACVDNKPRLKIHYRAIYGAVKSEKTAVLRNASLLEGSLMGKMVLSLPVRRDALFRNMMRKWNVTIDSAKQKMEKSFWLNFYDSTNYEELSTKLDNYLTQTGTVYSIREQVRVDSLIRAMGLSTQNAVVLGASIIDTDGKYKAFNSKMDVMAFLEFTLRKDVPRAEMKDIPNMRMYRSLLKYMKKSDELMTTDKRIRKVTSRETLRKLTMTPLTLTIIDDPKKMFDMTTSGLVKFANWARESLDTFKKYTGLSGETFDDMAEELKDRSPYPKTFLCNLLRGFVRMFAVNNVYMVTDFRDKGNLMQNMAMLYRNRLEPNFIYDDSLIPEVVYSEKKYNIMKASLMVSENLDIYSHVTTSLIGEAQDISVKLTRSMKQNLRNYLIMNYLTMTSSVDEILYRIQNREWYAEAKPWSSDISKSSFVYYKGILIEIAKNRIFSQVEIFYYMVKGHSENYNMEDITNIIQSMVEYSKKEIVGYETTKKTNSLTEAVVAVGGANYNVVKKECVEAENIMFKANSKGVEVSLDFRMSKKNFVKFILVKDNSTIYVDKEVDTKRAGEKAMAMRTLLDPKSVTEEEMYETMAMIDKTAGYKLIEDNFVKLFDYTMDFPTYSMFTKNARTSAEQDDVEVFTELSEEMKMKLADNNMPINMDRYKMNVWNTVLSDYEKTLKKSVVLDIAKSVEQEALVSRPFSMFAEDVSTKGSEKEGITLDFGRMKSMGSEEMLKEKMEWGEVEDIEFEYVPADDLYKSSGKSSNSAGPSTFGHLDFSKLADISEDVMGALSGMNYNTDSDRRGSTVEVLRKGMFDMVHRSYKLDSIAVRECFENYKEMLVANNPRMEANMVDKLAVEGVFGYLVHQMSEPFSTPRAKLAARRGKKKPKENMMSVFAYLVFSVEVKEILEIENNLKISNILLFPISKGTTFSAKTLVTKR